MPMHPIFEPAFQAMYGGPQQRSFRDGYTDHGDRYGVIAEVECPVCGESYDTPADDDSGCPNRCPNQDGESCDYCGEIYYGEACECGGADADEE